MSAEEDVKKDAALLYLGNLGTVEFDLKLPSRGESGSTISWHSDNERWIENDGKVHRPEYGHGDREVTLTAKLVKETAETTRKFVARVLQQALKIEISYIFPIYMNVQTGVIFYLPTFVPVRTKDDRLLSLRVNWNGGVEHTLNADTTKVYYGYMEGTEVEVQAKIRSSKKPPSRPIDSTPAVTLLGIEHFRITGNGLLAQNQARRLAYLYTVNDDQLLVEFRKASGLDTKGAPEMVGWDSPECQLRGHTTGHTLSAYSLAYAATGDAKIFQKLSYLIKGLKEVQDAFFRNTKSHFGFLSAYDESQFDDLENYVPYPTIWAPYYTLHKILAGLLDAHKYIKSSAALEIASKVGEWVFNRLSKLSHEQLQKMWSMYIAGEFGGMNEVLARLYGLTHNRKHLKAAELFDNDRLIFPLRQNVDALGDIHANQHIPQVIGFVELFKATGSPHYLDQAKFFWKLVVRHHTYAMGGTGQGEMFRQPNVIGSLLEDNTAESCATYNMLKLTALLSEYDPNRDYAEYYENATLNHIAATTDHVAQGGSIYFLPTNPNARKGYDKENSCCHGSGLESHFYYALAANYLDQEALYLNLYLNGVLKHEDEGIDIQEILSDFEPEKVTLHVKELKKKELKLRIPGWSGKQAIVSLSGNGIASHFKICGGNEVKLTRKHLKAAGARSWSGVAIDLQFDPHITIIRTPDKPEVAAICWGPYLLAALSTARLMPTVRLKESDADSSFERENKSLTFVHLESGLRFIPLWQINNESFSLYVNVPLTTEVAS